MPDQVCRFFNYQYLIDLLGFRISRFRRVSKFLNLFLYKKPVNRIFPFTGSVQLILKSKQFQHDIAGSVEHHELYASTDT